MNTTAGSYSLLGSVVPDDAGVVKKLRKAGAIILGEQSNSIFQDSFSDTCDLSLSQAKPTSPSFRTKEEIFLLGSLDAAGKILLPTFLLLILVRHPLALASLPQ